MICVLQKILQNSLKMDIKDIISRIWFNYAGNPKLDSQLKADAIEEVWVSLGFSREELAFEILNNLLEE